MKKLIYILGIIFFLQSCKKKEDPVPVIESPVFFISGELDTLQIELKAGINNYFMYTDISRDNMDSVNIFNGTFRQNNCATCKGIMQFSFRGNRTTNPGDVSDTTELFNQGLFPYFNSTTIASRYLVSFKSSLSSISIQSYKWNFGDGGTSAQVNPYHFYNALQNYSVTLSTINTSGCESSISNNVNTGEVNSSCNSFISIFKNGNYTIFNCTAMGANPYTFLWDFGDGVTTNQQSPSHQFTTTGLHTVCYTMIDNSGCQYATCMNVRSGDTLCDNNFSRGIPTEVPNPKDFSTITVKWTDENGNIFTTDNITQPSYTYYKVLSVENYKANSNGQPVKKLHVQFSCLLYNQALNQTIVAKNMNGEIGIAY